MLRPLAFALSAVLALASSAAAQVLEPYNIALPAGCSVIDYNGQPAIVIAVPGTNRLASFCYPVPPYITKKVALHIEAVMVVDYRPAAVGFWWDISYYDTHQARFGPMPASGVYMRAPFGVVLQYHQALATVDYTVRYCRPLYQSCTPSAPQWTVAICTVTIS